MKLKNIPLFIFFPNFICGYFIGGCKDSSIFGLSESEKLFSNIECANDFSDITFNPDIYDGFYKQFVKKEIDFEWKLQSETSLIGKISAKLVGPKAIASKYTTGFGYDYMANGPILELSGQEVKFSVEKATNDIHISISAENPLTEASWEIVLGVEGGLQSVIRKSHQGQPLAKVWHTYHQYIEWRNNFTLKVNENKIGIYDKNGTSIIEYVHSEQITENIVYISTWANSEGEWDVRYTPLNPSEIGSLIEKEFYTGFTYDYMANGPILELNGRAVKFSVEQTTNDIHLSISADNPLTPDSWEIVLGGWGGHKSVIRKSHQGHHLATVEHTYQQYLEWRDNFTLKINGNTIGLYEENGDIIIEYVHSEEITENLLYISSWPNSEGVWHVEYSPAIDELTELSDTIPYYSDISSYIGILRLQVEFCPLNLLEQIEHNNLVKFAIGDEIKEEGQIEKSKNKVHLDSISLIQDVGEKWNQKSLFIQFSRSKDLGDSSNDLLLSLKIDRSYFRDSQLELQGITNDVIKNCLENVSLKIIDLSHAHNYLTENKTKDFTRLAAFMAYKFESNWDVNYFLPEVSDGFVIGGCKDDTTYPKSMFKQKNKFHNEGTVCKNTCNFHEVGRRGKNLRFKWELITESTYMGEVKAKNSKHFDISTSIQPYIGMVRLDVTYCPFDLLEEISRNNFARIDIGGSSRDDYFLESVSFIKGIPDPIKWRRTSLFVQFRKTHQSTFDNKQDKFYITMNVDRELHDKFIADDIKNCLENIHFSVLMDDGAKPFENDYTRCATYERFDVDKAKDWLETEVFSKEEEFSVGQNKLIGTIPIMYKDWIVSLDIKPLSRTYGWTSVIHIGKGGDHSNYGDRNPAIFFHSDTGRMHIRTALSGQSNAGFDNYKSDELRLNVWTTVIMRQLKQEDGGWDFTVDMINHHGKLNYFRQRNMRPEIFTDMKIYAGDGYYTKADALIRNLKISTEIET